jgi:hypothetical protein
MLASDPLQFRSVQHKFHVTWPGTEVERPRGNISILSCFICFKQVLVQNKTRRDIITSKSGEFLDSSTKVFYKT